MPEGNEPRCSSGSLFSTEACTLALETRKESEKETRGVPSVSPSVFAYVLYLSDCESTYVGLLNDARVVVTHIARVTGSDRFQRQWNSRRFVSLSARCEGLRYVCIVNGEV